MSSAIPQREVLIDGALDSASTSLAAEHGYPSAEFGGGPANEIVANLARALMREHTMTQTSDVSSEDGSDRWAASEALGLLTIGCGAFWLLLVEAVRIFV